MALYKRIVDWTGLPKLPPCLANESFELDFKADHSSDACEMAKDIAAFANAFGGVILVGVHEKAPNYVQSLIPLDKARKIMREYENAAKDQLAPRPLVDPVILFHPDDTNKTLIAVNVDPFPGQVIGARTEKRHWRFPMRTAARHCIDLTPEHIAMYNLPQTRKAAILLSQIPNDAKIGVQLMVRIETTEPWSMTEEMFQGTFAGVDVHENVVKLLVPFRIESKQVPMPVHAPLEDVTSVWKAFGEWNVRLAGTIRQWRPDGAGQGTIYTSGRGPNGWV